MEEARRFLRYVIPGLTLIIEVSLYLCLSSFQQFVQLIKALGKDVAFPISVVLASGGIGFLLGVVYYGLFRSIEKLWVNHIPLIKAAVNRGWVTIQKRDDGERVDVNDLTQSGAWHIVTSFWHERKESSSKIKAATPRTDSLADITHGLGTTFISSLIAIPVWLFTHFKFSGEFPCLYCYFIPLLISFICFINFRRVMKDFQSIVDIIMADVFQEEFFQKKAPTIISVASIDLQKSKNKK